jgi:catechol 2,3-dioxygenase-like lactoylglutathione lyase family enzyme
MNILEVELLTDNLEETELFYTQTLGLDVVNKSDDSVSFKIGKSTLVFVKSQNLKPVYHFAFNIPNNQLDKAILWSSARFKLLEVEEGSYVANFDSWNAKSVYFYDNNGNILEFIARFDLDNTSSLPFSSKSIQSISEIGFVTSDPVDVGDQMIKDYNLNYFEKGAKSKQFATLGDDNGLLIIVENGRKWYPTQLKAVPYPTKFTIRVNGIENTISVNT